MEMLETKDAPMEFKATSEPGAFRAYGAVFGNVDDDGDVIEAGAFKKIRTKSNGKIRIPIYHDMSRIVGEADVVQDTKGLKVTGQLNMSLSYAADVYELMKDGSMDAMSVGFNVLEGGSKWSDDYMLRTITKAELWEVSLVPFGMNRKAKLTSVKAAIATVDWRALESDVRKHHSRSDALAIVALCKTHLREAGADVPSDSERQASEALALRKLLADHPISF